MVRDAMQRESGYKNITSRSGPSGHRTPWVYTIVLSMAVVITGFTTALGTGLHDESDAFEVDDSILPTFQEPPHDHGEDFHAGHQHDESGWSGRYAHAFDALTLTQETAEGTSGICKKHTPHDPIEIVGDSGFTTDGSGVVNPDAAGTPADPFIIEGWCITDHGSTGAPDQAILLQSTTAHVIIRDNHIERVVGYPDAIVLNGADNVVVQGNTVLDHVAGDGVYLQESHHNLIQGNTILHRTGHDYSSALRGIYLVESTDNIIRGNNLTRHGYSGITFQQSTGNTIEGNTITKNGVYRGSGRGGIHLDESPYNVINDNYIADNAWLLSGNFFASLPGIRADASPENTFSGNDLERGGFHFRQRGYLMLPQLQHFDQHFDGTNTVNGAPFVYLRDASDAVIPQDAGQVYVVNSTDVLLSGLDTYNATFGVVVAFSERITVRDSTFREHSEDGIFLVGTTDSLVTNNTITDSRFHGIRLAMTTDTVIQTNTLSDNTYCCHAAIELELGSSGNSVEDNTVLGTGKSGGYGIIVYGGNNISPEPSSGNVVIGNTVIGSQNSKVGIGIWYSNDNLVEQNTVSDVGGHGIEVKLSHSGVIVRANVVTNNTDTGIHILWSSNILVENNHVASNGRGDVQNAGINVCCSHAYPNNALLNNTVVDSDYYGIFVSRPNHLTIEGNNIHGSEGPGLMVFWEAPVTPLSPVQATNNWWGHPTGPGPGSIEDPLPPLPAIDACLGVPTGGLGNGLATLGTGVCFFPWLSEPNPEAGPH